MGLCLLKRKHRLQKKEEMAAVDNDTRNMVRFNMSHLCLRWDLRNGANSINRGRLDNLTFNQVVRGSNPRTLMRDERGVDYYIR